jgi:hypothetical protein
LITKGKYYSSVTLLLGAPLAIGRTEEENENKFNMLGMQLLVASMMDWVETSWKSNS